MKKNPSSVAVIGSGIAGLSAAIRLAVQGKQVVVFEQNPYTGGKVTAFEKHGFRFDMGPSLFTMPHLVEELFELAGRIPKDYFQYHTHDEVCRYFWLDGKRLTLYPSVDENIESITSVFGTDSGKNVRKYFDDARKKFELTAPFFLESSLHKMKTFLSPRVLKVVSEIPRLGLFSTLDDQNKRYFKEPKLVQLFNEVTVPIVLTLARMSIGGALCARIIGLDRYFFPTGPPTGGQGPATRNRYHQRQPIINFHQRSVSS